MAQHAHAIREPGGEVEPALVEGHARRGIVAAMPVAALGPPAQEFHSLAVAAGGDQAAVVRALAQHGEVVRRGRAGGELPRHQHQAVCGECREHRMQRCQQQRRRVEIDHPIEPAREHQVQEAGGLERRRQFALGVPEPHPGELG